MNPTSHGDDRQTSRVSLVVPGDPDVSAALHLPAEPSGVAFALAPGAGTTMESPFLVTMADRLAARGHAVMRFNFGYQERGSRRPDPKKALVATYRAAAEALRARARGCDRLVIGGRSMGGRMASMLAAEGYACDGLVLLGYPLHPAGKPHELRDEHLPRVPAPMLFVQGTRDALCDLALLRPVLARVGPSAALLEIEGGDHSFEVRKKDGRTYEEVLDQIVNGVDAFLTAR